METSALTEILDIQLLRIRPITVIMNTLNAFNAIHNLNNSPLRNLVINPLPELIVSQHTTEKSIYKGFVSKIIRIFASNILANLVIVATVNFF